MPRIMSSIWAIYRPTSLRKKFGDCFNQRATKCLVSSSWCKLLSPDFMFFRKDKKMALVQLANVDQAMQALIVSWLFTDSSLLFQELHNCQLNETSHLRISFSKMAIWLLHSVLPLTCFEFHVPFHCLCLFLIWDYLPWGFSPHGLLFVN